MRASPVGLVLAIAVTNPGQISYTANSGTKRSVASKLGDTVSICDFEATCPSGGDDTAAVNAAIAALPANGGKLIIPAGTFNFNASTITKSIDIECAGSGNVNTGAGGTRINPTTLSSPIFQFGNGAATTARGMRLANCILVGDGLNATGDGLYIYGARDVTIDNMAITAFGRNAIRIQCNTTSSSGIHIRSSALATNGGPALSIETCAGSFTSDVTVTDSHINGGSAAGSHAIYLDSTDLRLLGTYLDIHDAVTGGGVKLVKTGGGNPIIRCSASTIDNADGAASVSIDVSSWLTAANRMSTVISGACTVNGEIKYSDATVAISATREAAFLQPWINNLLIFNSLRFPLDETDAATNAVTLSRLNATGSNTEALSLGNAAMRIPGTVTFPMQWNGTSVWRDATSGALRSRLSNNPSGDHQGVQITPILVAPAYSASITIDNAAGSVFWITATNNTAFTINTPSNTSSSTNSMTYFEVCVINTSGAGLGVATWSGNWHLAGAWTQPATGNRRCAGFRADATAPPVWYETWRSAADVAN